MAYFVCSTNELDFIFLIKIKQFFDVWGIKNHVEVLNIIMMLIIQP